ncbi:MAG: hypothetical protein RL680_988 [Actinomycetota bacterium]
MTARKKYPNVVPSLKNWGGVRSIQRNLERSETIHANREAVAYALLCIANTRITDIMDWDEAGNVRVKRASDIPDHALQSIKKISVRTDRDGNNHLDIELYDKIGVLRLLAKASGLLDSPDQDDKPSVIDVNVVAPPMRDV